MGTVLIGLRRGEVTLVECHVNVWTLPSFSDELSYFDVGLLIRRNPNTDALRSFSLGIPARLAATDATCLVTKIGDLGSWQLVFRDCTEVQHGPGDHWHHTILKGGRQVLRMTEVDLEPDPELKTEVSAYSFWRVSLKKPLPAGAETYLRVRFAVAGRLGGRLGGLDISKDLGIYERVRTYDIRVNELREQVELEPTVPFSEVDICQPERVNVFLIVRPGYTPRIISPTTKYVRLLEGKGWEPYLQRHLTVFGVRKPPKLVIYAWERAGNRSFRAVASFHRDLGRLDALTLSAAAFTTLVGTTIGVAISQPQWFGHFGGFFVDQAYEFVLAGSLALGALALYGSTVLVPPLTRVKRRMLRVIDGWLYGMRLGA